ncbi:MAG TPA: hypothetical protein VNW29_07100 [Candidatus Sulfotelmatobacter sp.]|jgi:tRNA pseudouridine55 synthase|nr:hypothetical protein [Candidatus Sulfotelmatobacter sp.]
MEKLLVVNKPSGMTPLEAINKIRYIYPELSQIKIGYAGRLDPLAHGVLVLMVGEETKKRDTYLSLPKIYEFEVLFGLKTDTYDLLGILEDSKIQRTPVNVNILVNIFVNNHIGFLQQQYPPYSSKTIKGKPLFWWAKNDKLNEIKIPTKKVEIYEFNCLRFGEIKIIELKHKVYSAIESIHGDFRQETIKKRWEEIFDKMDRQTLKTAKFRIRCSSGTYVRALVSQLGKEIRCGAVTIDILRTKVGIYTLNEAVDI